MNSHANRVGDIYDIISRTDAIPIVLYPGEEWRVGERFDCQPALSRYAEDMEKALAEPAQYSVHTVPVAQLMDEAEKFRRQMLNSHPVMILRLIPGTTIWIKDYGKAFTFSYRHGLRADRNIAQEGCDISAVSGAISHCFTTAWGADTLHVNGCFVSPANKHGRFFSCMAPSRYSNAGIKLDLTVTVGSIGRKVRGIFSKPARSWQNLQN